jgi:Abnormal spindle-like microcephaly-assoc'd, ASPM-SPD-2-Hydin
MRPSARLGLLLILSCACLPAFQGKCAAASSRPQANSTPVLLSVPWSPLAPTTLVTPTTGPSGGRILGIAVDPADATGNTVYLATTGGVWKSTDAAALSGNVSFAPVTDAVPAVGTLDFTTVNAGAITVQPGGTGVVLAGTGDPTGVSDAMYGIGLLRSADNGATWSVIREPRDPTTGLNQGSFFGEAFTGFAWGTSSPNFVVAALTPAVGAYSVNAGYISSSTSGLYYSQDAGRSWQMATVQDGQYKVLQSANLESAGVPVLSVVWNPIRRIFVAAIRSHGFYSSLDGITWNRMAQQPGTALSTSACPFLSSGGGSPNCPIYHAGLAVQPGTGDMFAIATSQSDTDSGLWQDVCAAANGSCSSPAPTFARQLPVSSLETTAGSIAGASHSLVLEAIPSGSDTLLFAGTQDLFRCSLAAGCVWRNATNVNTCAAAQVGATQHSVATVRGTAMLFFGNDHGLWRTRDAINQQSSPCSSDDASHFDNLNGSLAGLVDVTSLAQDPADANQLMAGLVRVGTAGGGNGAWESMMSTQGAYAQAGWGSATNMWFATSGPGVSISRCSLGSLCGPGDFGTGPVVDSSQVSGDGNALKAPAVWALDPQDPSRIIVATCRMWRGLSSGQGWSTSSELSGMLDGQVGPSCLAGNSQVRALAASGTIPGRADGAERIYAGLAGFPDGATSHPGHVLSALVTPASTAASTTWSDLTASPVPNDPTDSHTFNPGEIGISSIAIDPSDATGSTVYVGLSAFGGSGFAETSNVPTLYGSTDAGQHWSNLTNGLPNAPVNAVLIDPLDPAIVYVGTDVGVYVTTSIAQCANTSQNCWAPYGIGLPAVRITSLSAAATGGASWLRAGTKGRGVWQAELASVAIRNAPATATVTPASLVFASQAVGTISAPQTLAIQNTGRPALTLSTIVISTTDFVLSGQCPATLAAGASCSLSVVFAPTATGSRSATLSVPANVQGGSIAVSLTGTATQGSVIVLTPLRMDFGAMILGQTSPVQYLTIANTGTQVATLQQPTTSGPFAITANTCGTVLSANTSCTLGLHFTPTASGTALGTLSVSDSAGTQTAVLSGTGQAGATDALSATALSFRPQAEGTVSAPQQVLLTNNGDASLAGIAAQITGDFTVTSGCGISLPAHSTCAFQIAFAPKAVGAESGTLTVQDLLHQQVVALRGTGTVPATQSGAAATLSPQTMDFGTQGINTSSTPQTLTFINNGSVALSGITVVATTGYQIGSNGCTVTIGPGASCTLDVIFAPQTAGPLSGTVQVSASGLAAPVTVSLTGSGADFQLAVQGASSSIVTGGKTATYQLLLTPVGASVGSVTFNCGGLPAGSSCVFNPASATLTGTGATATIQVSITTVAANAVGIVKPSSAPWRPRQSAGGLIALGSVLLLRRRRWAEPLRPCGGLLVLGALCLALSGCGLSIHGGSSSSPGAGTPGQGIYGITVGGTAPGVSHSVSLTLTVE